MMRQRQSQEGAPVETCDGRPFIPASDERTSLEDEALSAGDDLSASLHSANSADDSSVGLPSPRHLSPSTRRALARPVASARSTLARLEAFLRREDSRDILAVRADDDDDDDSLGNELARLGDGEESTSLELEGLWVSAEIERHDDDARSTLARLEAFLRREDSQGSLALAVHAENDDDSLENELARLRDGEESTRLELEGLRVLGEVEVRWRDGHVDDAAKGDADGDSEWDDSDSEWDDSSDEGSMRIFPEPESVGSSSFVGTDRSAFFDCHDDEDSLGGSCQAEGWVGLVCSPETENTSLGASLCSLPPSLSPLSAEGSLSSFGDADVPALHDEAERNGEPPVVITAIKMSRGIAGPSSGRVRQLLALAERLAEALHRHNKTELKSGRNVTPLLLLVGFSAAVYVYSLMLRQSPIGCIAVSAF